MLELKLWKQFFNPAKQLCKLIAQNKKNNCGSPNIKQKFILLLIRIGRVTDCLLQIYKTISDISLEKQIKIEYQIKLEKNADKSFTRSVRCCCLYHIFGKIKIVAYGSKNTWIINAFNCSISYTLATNVILF